jgi:ubiquinone/menaquinone biosynthesis C-methylase UbiE
MSLEKNHYYDGKIYEALVDPALDEIRQIIDGFIEANSSVVDIACGTGALAFKLAEKSSCVTGIELSPKMVSHANGTKDKLRIVNVKFKLGDAANLPEIKNKTYDYATVSLALHEMPVDLRKKVLLEMSRIAKKIIVADYLTPMPYSINGAIVKIIELIAGFDHFKNFRSFQRNNGLSSLLKTCGFSVVREKINQKGIISIIEAS